MGSLCIYYRGSTGIISKKSMNEDSVALIMCARNVYTDYEFLKKDLELSANIFLTNTSCYKLLKWLLLIVDILFFFFFFYLYI